MIGEVPKKLSKVVEATMGLLKTNDINAICKGRESAALGGEATTFHRDPTEERPGVPGGYTHLASPAGKAEVRIARSL